MQLLITTLLATLLLILIGAQTAVACVSPGDGSALRVNTCHMEHQGRTASLFCCNNISCHPSSPPARQLAGPEVSSRIKSPLPLIVEYRQPLPQPRAGHPMESSRISRPMIQAASSVSTAPRHAHHILRTTILLH